MIPAAPIWSEFQTPEYPRLPGGTLRTDVAVIGGGLAGLSAAYHLLGRLPPDRHDGHDRRTAAGQREHQQEQGARPVPPPSPLSSHGRSFDPSRPIARSRV